MRNHVLLVIGLLALAYAGVAVTPIKASIGRSHPGLAAAFSAPLFNFHAEYSAGEVLDFSIGMTREQFRAVLVGYSGVASLVASCGGGTKTTMVELDDAMEAFALTQRDVVCLWSDARRLSLIFNFKENRVDRIEMSVVNTEII